MLANRAAVRVDGRPVAAGDRAGELELVLDRPEHQRLERPGRRAGRVEQARGRTVERDEVVRREDRARVVERPRVVRELEGAQAEEPRELEALCERLRVLAGDRSPRTVELIGPAPRRERLQGVDAETTDVRVERRERRRSADVGDPWAGLDRARDLGDRRVGHAEEHELGLDSGQLDAALA